MEVASADIVVNGLIGDQRYRSGSGDMVFRDAGGSLVVEAMSGDVDIVANGPARFDLRTVSGDLELRAGPWMACARRPRRATLPSRAAGGEGPFLVETVSGDIELAPTGDVRVDVRTISGDLRSALPGRMEEGGGRRSFIGGAGGPEIDVRSTSGDVHVGRPTAVGAAAPRRLCRPSRRPSRLQHRPPTAPMATDDGEAGLDVLRALERGEIDIDEARVAPRPAPATARPGSRPTPTGETATPTPTRPVQTPDEIEARRCPMTPWSRAPPHRRRPPDRGRGRPVLDALAARPDATTDDHRVATAEPATSPGGGPGRAIRLEVREGGRKVLHLRVPIALGRAALTRVPGLSDMTRPDP